MLPQDPPPWPLRTLQQRTLEAVDATDRERIWVVLPPGAGKTLVGLSTAQRWQRRTVVLCPNLAIQQQWLDTWQQMVGPGHGSTDRRLDAELTVLTYQSLAVFDDEDGAGPEPRSHIDRLHPRGAELLAALQQAGPLTLVLDECHHLLQAWGQLLDEILQTLPEARVLGLTATPPQSLTTTEATLLDRLFGRPLYTASIPAAVRLGELSPFAELAWLTPPTDRESDYLHRTSSRFTELINGLADPARGTTPLFTWLDLRLSPEPHRELQTAGFDHLRHSDPELADALLRLAHCGFVQHPDGIVPAERHRADPTGEDWAIVWGDWVAHCLSRSGDADDALLISQLRRTLPAVGLQLVGRTVRRTQSPVDRVLARSAAKAAAAVEIAATEHRIRGESLRGLVLCDFVSAGATLPADLDRVMDQQAGSAVAVIRAMTADAATSPLAPIMITGEMLLTGRATAQALIDRLRRLGLRIEATDTEATTPLFTITGWDSPADRLRSVTDFLTAGGTRLLIGTRALLGEGWDAPAVNCVIDLTTATTATAVVQSRGRALRLDPADPQKVATTWSVVCIAEDHPLGQSDWNRFVRKHRGYWGVDPAGMIMNGVAHLDPGFTEQAAPPSPTWPATNERSVSTAADHDRIRERWQVGTPFTDREVPTLLVRPQATARRTAAPAAIEQAPVPQAVWSTLGPVLSGGSRLRWLSSSRSAELHRPVTVFGLACALADALATIGRLPAGSEGVEATPEPDGSLLVRWRSPDHRGAGGHSTSESPVGDPQAVFIEALDELLGPITATRWLVTRFLAEPATGDRWRALWGTLRPSTAVHHAVPRVFRGSRQRVAFGLAWARWVAVSELLDTRTAEGAAILDQVWGTSPLDLTTAFRLSWE
ncbi:DEAD/DEAH box helicase family protein [Naumannella halotolerans]|uniref:Superfamily II DNA or RNA helicase n=1 Tax=Naumannella halotolerans TaxID=993414 RepID=A0A4R7JCW0_9ACTN|nr:DEAD/DEAH box helicase family protein [Naumannella halotolerans]TDT34523.1 superfamily II DNA or RNA helicase [Naumannella halotolerans]